jgi:hypothetical protein
MYTFEEQNEKGKYYEQNFFDHLKAKGQEPEFNNPDGNNKEYDIIANGLKYEVKTDFYQNERFPIELVHLKNNFTVLRGWLFLTESDCIVFYKPHLSLRYYLRTKTLREYVEKGMPKLLSHKITNSDNKKTWNCYLTESELEAEKILIRKEPY